MDLLAPEAYLRKILTSSVYEIAHETPLERAYFLSQRLGCGFYIKREDMQLSHSFKVRGAYNKMAQLSKAVRERGVVVASAGNHAQGVAISAQKLGNKATIFMPKTAPEVKVAGVKRYGAETVITGDIFQQTLDQALAFADKEQKQFISPYDDPDIIAGQGTVGIEIINQHPGPIDVIFIPVGGGGLISGVAAYVKQVRPEVKIVGVEPFDADALFQSLDKQDRIYLREVGVFADGVAVSQVGHHGFDLCQRFVDEVIRVSTDEICAAIKDIFEDTRAIVEPSGALAIAGAKAWVRYNKVNEENNLVAIASGANMNFDRLRHVSERAEIGERREAILAVTIPEQKGSFLKFCRLIGDRSVSEFNYRYSDADHAQIFVGVKIRAKSEIETLMSQLDSEGLPATDLTDNEMAKLHARYMVGGRMPTLTDERVFRFDFPERPGALGNFLEKIGSHFNISLFHYRNHGSDFGRVLCGIQVPDTESEIFQQSLSQLGYNYIEETDNPVYHFFLK